MQAIIDLLKTIAALAILIGIGHYWFTKGPPPRGRGRWRNVLNDLEDRPNRHPPGA